MSIEVVPVMGIETYYKDPTFNYLEDNCRVPIAGAVFRSHVPAAEAESIQQNPDAPKCLTYINIPGEPRVPKALENGLMNVMDTYVLLVQGKEHTL